MHIPRCIISGLSGGAGKTMVSLGLARAFSRSGLSVRAFKKGPDYIDAAWLALASRGPQGNLDPFFTPGQKLTDLFRAGAKGADLALVEGNRGLFDGLDIDGSCSTAEVARLLDAPVLLLMDCTKMTRTAAALVRGCLDFEPGLHIGGVILNRTGNPRHQAMVRRAVEELAGVPVLGVLPRRAEPFILERHMGLVGLADSAADDEPARADALLDALADFMADHVDLRAVLKLANGSPPLPDPDDRQDRAGATTLDASPSPPAAFRPRIGYAHDAAFWFYYRENLDALEQAGAELLPLSLLDNAPWPHLDGLYLGGGLPELHAEALSENVAARERVAALAAAGLPIYAECGGFMYLAEQLIVDGHAYPMAGVFPVSVECCARPQGLGYVEAEALLDNPYHPVGTRFRGHEFHFSRCIAPLEQNSTHILRLHKGSGMAPSPDGAALDGLLRGNTFAAYTHIYAPALPHWAPAFVDLCARRK